MPMPTTRRGRFLLYKQRQRRRLKRVYCRAKNATTEDGGVTSRTTRRFDIQPYVKQNPRVYPLHFPEKSMTALQWFGAGWLSPERGRWGVVGSPPTVPTVLPFGDARNGAHVNYHDRRVKSIPHLKLLEVLDWPEAQDALTYAKVYPNEFYPSGRRSYASVRGWV